MAPKPPYQRVPSSVGMGVRLRLALNLCTRIKEGRHVRIGIGLQKLFSNAPCRKHACVAA